MLVGEIRTALGDDPRRPKFIRTVHRFGYAFSGTAAARPDRNSEMADAGEASYWIVSPRQHIALFAGENMIGRCPQASIWLDRTDVSRRHARIVIGHDGAVLEDLGSKNGTFARGQRIAAPVPLHDGDQLRFGSTSVMFRIWSGARSTQTNRRRDRRVLVT
jgi:hypothetical protein